MDRHKKRFHVTFALTHKEFARLNVVLTKTSQPAQTLLGHFFEALAGASFKQSFFLPLVKFFKIGGTTGVLSVRLSDEAYAVMREASEKRCLFLGYIARVMCIRSIEFCEQKGTRILPEKEEIRLWLEERSEPHSAMRLRQHR